MLSVGLSRATLVAVGITATLHGSSRAQSVPTPFTEGVATITQADCTSVKLGAETEPRWVPGTNALPARCEVNGRISAINYRVWLPAEWNRRSVQQGGGGMNGSIPDLTGARYPIEGRSLAQRGFVTYGSDSGHQSGSQEWALNDEAITNLGYMQLKKTHDAAMTLVERAYGERPRFRYFTGNSQGGREALTVAQRYPTDYNGIIANVPIVSFSSLMLAPELIRIREKPLANWVTRAKTNAIRAEFMRQCDHLDGLTDGVINDYMACRAIFDVSQGARTRRPWAAKRCAGNRDPDPANTNADACLTDGQIGTLEFIYSRYKFAAPLAHAVKTFGMWVPNTDPGGSGLIADVRFRGQEGAQLDAPMHTHLGVLGVTGFLMRDLSANPLDYVEGSRWSARRVELSAILDSTDPDLRAFARHGGKMIVTIGTNDTLASPGAQLDYYEALIEKMGRRAVEQFARLLVIPQANHGLMASTADIDGQGRSIERSALPTNFDRFAYLVEWVERGTAPATTLVLSGGGKTMPLCSYPSFPKYTGGTTTDARSYQCASR